MEDNDDPSKGDIKNKNMERSCQNNRKERRHVELIKKKAAYGIA